MKKILFLFAIALGSLTSCYDDDEQADVVTYDVNVELNYAEDATNGPKDGVEVKLTSSTGVVYNDTTNALGVAKFNVPVGIYKATASSKVSDNGYVYNYNGENSNITVTEQWTGAEETLLKMVGSRSGQIVIKELYNGGVAKDDGSGKYQFDKYVILYNNSNETASVKNFCLGMVNPYNAEAADKEYIDGKLKYEDLGFTPAGCGIWYLAKDFTLAAGEEVTIALCGAIDHTTTYENSVDLSNADYCLYDMDDFDNTKYYPAPSEKIATENYFSAYKYGMGNAWPLSVVSPAFYIFSTGDVNPETFASDSDYYFASGFEGKDAFKCAKVKNEWILDAIEVFSKPSEAKAKKRLATSVEAGYVTLTNFQGHTLYRNVDKEATEAIAENQGKLVYDYNLGVEGNTDPSGINAEASMKNGARIIYLDSNNSSNDFHERVHASLKD